MSRGTSIFLWFMAFSLLLGLIGFGIYHYYINFQYEKIIGSYMGNAIDMVAPEGMLEQIQLSKQGMIDAGLTEDDYGAWIFKKPDNSMKFQYQHIGGLIERINSVIEWKEKTYGNQSLGTETLGDVYEQKMTNLRQYIRGETIEGYVGERSDWIAKNAWIIKYHFIIYIAPLFYILGLIILGIIILIASALWRN